MTIIEKIQVIGVLAALLSALAIYASVRAAVMADRRERELFHIETGEFILKQ